MISRRRFLANLFVAPAIIPAAKLMAVKSFVEPKRRLTQEEISLLINPPLIGNDYEKYVSYFRWMNDTRQLVAKDWRYVARIANS